MAKKQMGRPVLPEGEAKGVIVQTRVSEADHILIKEAVAASGVKLSEWLRQRILAAAKRELRHR